MAWAEAHTPDGRRRTAMFFEIYTAATRDPELQQTFLVPVVTEWLDPMAAAIEAAGAAPGAARSVASRILAVHRGLLLEDLALGCNVATDAAHRDAVLTIRTEISRATSSDEEGVRDPAE
ncbi:MULTISPECIES: TetR family transcriptional regulator [Rhodococcus]|uniref:TetR family transcriptional regulator n=1 Tax=Rhodococcus TaxID=1827 RepID=UPI002DD42892|nr:MULTISPECIES: TetR family transcriptional regulator [Rhodococcus]